MAKDLTTKRETLEQTLKKRSKKLIMPFPEDFSDGLPEVIFVAPNGYQINNDLFTYVNGQGAVITGYRLPQGKTDLTVNRHGAGYDYADPRNSYVMDFIHTLVLAKQIPNIGTRLRPDIHSFLSVEHEFTAQNETITIKDALAYCALFPFSLKVVRTKNITSVIGPGNPILNGKQWKMVPVGVAEMTEIYNNYVKPKLAEAAEQDGPFQPMRLKQSLWQHHKLLNIRLPKLAKTML